jgi:hypothetical protein
MIHVLDDFSTPNLAAVITSNPSAWFDDLGRSGSQHQYYPPRISAV